MKAAVCKAYGSPEVLEIRDIKKPVPNDNEVLIKIKATSVTIADSRVRGFNVPLSFWLPARMVMGITRPRQPILGGELAGVIESIGKNVKNFKKSDEVFAFTSHRFGANAEYICLNESDPIALKPVNLSFEESAVLSFGGATALSFLNKAGIKQGDKILIYGASGCVGTYLVQLAKYFGAEVTGVCSTGNLQMVESLGADRVIDYTTNDFTIENTKYDIVVDAVGKASITGAIKSLKENGTYVHLVSTPATSIRIKLALIGSRKKFIGGTFNATQDQIAMLKKLAEEKKIRPVIDLTFPFEQIAEAHRYVDKGHKKGNVVIVMGDS